MEQCATLRNLQRRPNTPLYVSSLRTNIKQTKTNAWKRKMNLQATRDCLCRRPRMEIEWRGEQNVSWGEQTRTRCFAATNNSNGEGLHMEKRPTMAYSVVMEKEKYGFSQLQWRTTSAQCYGREVNFLKL